MATSTGINRASVRTEVAAVATLTLAALLLRLIGSNGGLWIDEIYALLNSFRPPVAEIVAVFPGDNHHPLYSLLAHLSVWLFGEAPWTIRLPAVLSGAATVPLLYLLGRHLTTRREAMLASALLAVSYHHVWFSQNARGYAMLALFTIACTWCLLRLIEGGPRAWVIAYAAAAALGAYTHLTMVFVVIGHAVVGLALPLLPGHRGGGARIGPSLFSAFALAALGTLVLYAPVLLQVREFFDRPSALRGVSTPGWALVEMFRVLALGFSGGRIVLGAAVVAIAGFLFSLGLYSYARRSAIALALFTAPAGAILLGALVARGTFYPRFLFALIGFGILIGVRGVMAAAGWVARRWFARPESEAEQHPLGTILILVVLVLSLASLAGNYRHPKQDFAGAARYIDAHREPGEAVVTAGAAVIPFRDYLGRDWAPVATATDLDPLRRGRAVWLVYTFPRYLVHSAPEIMAIAGASCPDPRVFHGTVGGGDVLVCRIEPAP